MTKIVSVKKLDASFLEKLEQHNSIVLIYANWCRFCQGFFPVWESLSKEKLSKVKMYQISDSVIAQLIKKVQEVSQIKEQIKSAGSLAERKTLRSKLQKDDIAVHQEILKYLVPSGSLQFPTILMFKDGKREEYNGERDIESLKAVITEHFKINNTNKKVNTKKISKLPELIDKAVAKYLGI